MSSWYLKNKYKKILSSELGTIYKSPAQKIKICLVYPNKYYLGMSNLGFQTIYFLLNQREDVICERAFLPDKEDEQEFRRTRTPLFSLESQTPLFQFDLLAFSLSFELDYLNIPIILELGKIPLSAELRKEDSPLILAGGVCTLLNIEPISEFIDFFIIGEAEETLPEAIKVYLKFKNRKKILRELAELESIYVPFFYEFNYYKNGGIKKIKFKDGVKKKIKKGKVLNLNLFPTTSSIITPKTEFKDTYLIELSRGCPYFCCFCASSFCYAPFRKRTQKDILSLIDKGLEKTKNIGLVGTAISSHPYLEEIINFLVKRKAKVKLSSLRMDSLNTSLLKTIVAAGQETITLALESSERLRKKINKEISEEDINKIIKLANETAIKKIKIYFMIGLPFEEKEDIIEIIELVKEIYLCLREKKKLIISISSFIPKPNTPFQFYDFAELRTLEDKIKMIKEGIKKLSYISLNIESPRLSLIQATLAKGDRRLSKIIKKTYQTEYNFSRWLAAFKEEKINLEALLYKKINKEEILPWENIDV